MQNSKFINNDKIAITYRGKMILINDTVTARCEMQKKAEIGSQDVLDVLRTKMMDFPFKPGGQNFYCNIFSLLLFPHLA